MLVVEFKGRHNMKVFLNDELLINNKVGVELYNSIKDLPIIDYHCHLN